MDPEISPVSLPWIWTAAGPLAPVVWSGNYMEFCSVMSRNRGIIPLSSVSDPENICVNSICNYE